MASKNTELIETKHGVVVAGRDGGVRARGNGELSVKDYKLPVLR